MPAFIFSPTGNVIEKLGGLDFTEEEDVNDETRLLSAKNKEGCSTGVVKQPPTTKNKEDETPTSSTTVEEAQQDAAKQSGKQGK